MHTHSLSLALTHSNSLSHSLSHSLKFTHAFIRTRTHTDRQRADTWRYTHINPNRQLHSKALCVLRLQVKERTAWRSVLEKGRYELLSSDGKEAGGAEPTEVQPTRARDRYRERRGEGEGVEGIVQQEV